MNSRTIRLTRNTVIQSSKNSGCFNKPPTPITANFSHFTERELSLKKTHHLTIQYQGVVKIYKLEGPRDDGG